MDLGIRGRTAIVCASSQGLGKGCARALAEAGVSLVINGRNRTLLEQTRATVDMLKRHGFAVEYAESGGAHTWENWRDYLHTFAPRLFR